MSRERPDWFYLKTHKKIGDLRKAIPTAEQIVEKRLKQFKTNYPLRSLGLSNNGELWIAEEERVDHVHIIGTTGEGKSKFLEHLIRGDILAGNSVCLLDPTDNAETCYNILRWCAAQGFTKVCLIDPHLIHSHNLLTCIQPFNRDVSYKSASVNNVQDIVRILFQTKDASDTPRILRYLGALISVLWDAGMTLHESVYFSDYYNALYSKRREFILGQCHPLDRRRIVIEDVFRNYTRWQQYFSSTINRLEPFFDSSIDLTLGSDTGVDFTEMITDGWLILVNLDAERGVEPIHARLLATAVINELLAAMHTLREHGFNKPYYLYIDEAGQFVTDKLVRVLEYKRKSGFRVNLAHQGFFQFPRDKAQAVKQLTKIKVMFNTPDPDDRYEMIKALGYGGDIPHQMATFVNADLPKQYAVVKKGKEPPVRVKIPDVAASSNPWTQKIRHDFISSILTNPWNKSPAQVTGEYKQRFNEPTHRPTKVRAQTSRKRATPNRKADSNPPKTKRKSLLDIKD